MNFSSSDDMKCGRGCLRRGLQWTAHVCIHEETHARTHVYSDARTHRTKWPVWLSIRLFRRYSLLLSCVIGRTQVVTQNNTSKSNTVSRAWRSRLISQVALRCIFLQNARCDTHKNNHSNGTKIRGKYETFKKYLKD